MPKGPHGEKRPADVIGGAVTVGRIATGEIEEFPAVKSGRVKSGQAGGAARAESLTPERRSEVARDAASVRWRKTESAMEDKDQQGKAPAPQEQEASMYADNKLGKQFHDFEDTFSMSTAAKRAFDKK